MSRKRDWPRYAMVLDLRLEGQSLKAIGCQIGVTDERVRQMLMVARRRLAYRVFGTPPIKWVFDRERGAWMVER